VVVFAKVE